MCCTLTRKDRAGGLHWRLANLLPQIHSVWNLVFVFEYHVTNRDASSLGILFLNMHSAASRKRNVVSLSSRTVRRAISIATLCLLTIALCGLMRVLPLFHRQEPATAHTAALLPATSNHVSAVSSQNLCLRVALLLPDPVFAPIHLKVAALLEYRSRRGGGGGTTAGGENSVNVDPSDLRRAEENVVEALPLDDQSSIVGGLTGGSGCKASASSTQIFNGLRNFLQVKSLDAKPIFVDFGCVMGVSMARVHSNSTVICLLDGDEGAIAKTPLFGVTDRRPRNLLWLHARNGFLGAPFSQLYDACNFVTLGAVLVAIPLYPKATAVGNEQVTSLLRRVLPSVAVILVALRIEEEGGGGRYHSETQLCGALHEDLHETVTEFQVVYNCEPVAIVSLPWGGRERFGVLRLVLVSSVRPCRKTWGAPLVQWDRAQTVQFLNGAVTFRVHHVAKNSAASNKPSTMRTIHPLQYIHSLNLDTLLGAGLATPLRRQLLGQMIASPRYSDPLPHNWVVSGGGVVERIDKVDLRYDRDVDESKGYWGHSTRGYLHLLTAHLCLDVAPNGLPSVVEDRGAAVRSNNNASSSCRALCRSCAKGCAYLPKGTVPCPACLDCGSCIEAISRSSTTSSTVVTDESSVREKDGSVHCQLKYSSMHAARSVWKAWERADRKHIV